MNYPLVRVPFLNAAQMAEVDRAMIEDYRIDLVRMMENAGRNLALLARAEFLGGEGSGGTRGERWQRRRGNGLCPTPA